MLFSLLLAALPVSSTVSMEVHASLDAQHTRIRLVSDDAPLPSLDTMSREELQREARRLEAEKPGVGLPLALIISGAAVAYLGSQIYLVASDGSVGWLAALGISYAVAAVLVVVGVIVLINHLRARTAIDIQLDEIRQRMETPPGQPYYPGPPGQPPGQPVYPGPPPDDNTPPPPPPPPSVQNVGPAMPTVALLQF